MRLMARSCADQDRRRRLDLLAGLGNRRYALVAPQVPSGIFRLSGGGLAAVASVRASNSLLSACSCAPIFCACPRDSALRRFALNLFQLNKRGKKGVSKERGAAAWNTRRAVDPPDLRI